MSASDQGVTEASPLRGPTEAARRLADFRNPERAVTKKRRAVVALAPSVVAALVQARAIGRSDRVIEYGGRPVRDIRKGFAAALAAGLLAVAEAPTPSALRGRDP